MFEIIRFVIAAVLTLLGLAVLISGVVGVFRFRYALTRIHAAALNDTVGILLVVLGVMIAEGFTIAALKMVVVLIFLWMTSPVASHLIGRLEITINDSLEKDMTVEDPNAVAHEKEGEKL